MLHPVGPRSAGVYWIRRALVVVVAIAVVAAVVWFLVARGNGPQIDPAAENLSGGQSSQMTGVLATDSSDSTALSTSPGRTSDGHRTGSAAATSGRPTATKDGKDGDAGGTKSDGKKSGDDKSGDDKSGDDKSDGKKSGDDKSGDDKSDGKKSGDDKSGGKKSGDDKSGGKKSGDDKSGDDKSDGRKSGDDKSGDDKSDGKKSGDDERSGSTKQAATTATGRTAATRSATPSTTPSPKPSYDAQGRLLCPDSAIAVKATTGAPSYAAGSQPILGMTVTNTGSKSCVRDLSGPLQVYTVFSKAGARQWSTDDCFPGQGTDVRELAPGQTVSYNIKWSGTTSTPGCATPRVPVKPGGYTLVAALGTLKSAPKPFTITD